MRTARQNLTDYLRKASNYEWRGLDGYPCTLAFALKHRGSVWYHDEANISALEDIDELIDAVYMDDMDLTEWQKETIRCNY